MQPTKIRCATTRRGTADRVPNGNLVVVYALDDGDVVMSEVPVHGSFANLSAKDALDLIYEQLRDERRLSAQSLHRAVSDMERFVNHLTLNDIHRLRDVTQQVALDFIDASKHDGAEWRDPAGSTRHGRRSAIRTMFFWARQLNIAPHEPTLDIVLEPRRSERVRPLTDYEVMLGREQAQRTPYETRMPAAWALGEATASTSEIAKFIVADIDFANQRVWLAGSLRRAARWGALSDWGVGALERRANKLGDSDKRVVTKNSTGEVSGQAATCGAIHAVLNRAGLAADESVRPASLPAWKGRQIFDETNSIEVVALALGLRSLDSAASAIGWEWPE